MAYIELFDVNAEGEEAMEEPRSERIARWKSTVGGREAEWGTKRQADKRKRPVIQQRGILRNQYPETLLLTPHLSEDADSWLSSRPPLGAVATPPPLVATSCCLCYVHSQDR